MQLSIKPALAHVGLLKIAYMGEVNDTGVERPDMDALANQQIQYFLQLVARMRQEVKPRLVALQRILKHEPAIKSLLRNDRLIDPATKKRIGDVLTRANRVMQATIGRNTPAWFEQIAGEMDQLIPSLQQIQPTLPGSDIRQVNFGLASHGPSAQPNRPATQPAAQPNQGSFWDRAKSGYDNFFSKWNAANPPLTAYSASAARLISRLGA